MDRKPFILEGPDACGKTTLAHAIISKFGGRYIHLTFEDHLVELQWSALVEAANNPGITIIDRHWVSEQVYGSVYRNSVSTDPHAPWQINMFEQLEGIYIFCLPRPDKAFLYHREMAVKREELYESDGRTLQAAQAYYQFVYGTTDVNTAFGEINCLAKRVARSGGFLHQYESYVFDRSTHSPEEWLDMHASLFTC